MRETLMRSATKRLAVILIIAAVVFCISPIMNLYANKIQVVENSPYQGMTISILGDSISTFEGFIPTEDGVNLEHRAKYPYTGLVKNVNKTWWMQLVLQLDANLGVNDSWAGSTVSNFLDGNEGDLGEDAAMASLTRIQNLGSNGIPDVILFYGGTNDIGLKVPLGIFNVENAPTEVDLAATKWYTYVEAYTTAIMRLQYYYPDAKIVALLPAATTRYYTDVQLHFYNEAMMAICNHYGVQCIDLRESGLTTEHMPDGIHPNDIGMDYITQVVQDVLLESYELAVND